MIGNATSTVFEKQLITYDQLFKEFNLFVLNFGPQHPAAHGVLRMFLLMFGEIILTVYTQIGLLHRGTEKLMESRNFLQNLPYLDRLDYVSMMCQEHTYSMAVEAILEINLSSKRISFIRVMLIELTRILNHLMAITTHALDVGALNPFLWGFEEREKIMEFYERISGARMHAAYIRPGGLTCDLPLGILNDIYEFIINFNDRINEIDLFLTNNRIWRQRLINIGVFDTLSCENWALSGPIARSIGIMNDLRKNSPYEIYENLKFSSFISSHGDCYDRYLIRVEEMRESANIVLQCLNNISEGDINVMLANTLLPVSKNDLNASMENVINHFKYYCDYFSIPKQASYLCSEAPKGEFGVFIVTDGSNYPYRFKFRAPGFFNLQAINYLAFNLYIADMVTIIGSQDIVFGEIDR